MSCLKSRYDSVAFKRFDSDERFFFEKFIEGVSVEKEFIGPYNGFFRSGSFFRLNENAVGFLEYLGGVNESDNRILRQIIEDCFEFFVKEGEKEFGLSEIFPFTQAVIKKLPFPALQGQFFHSFEEFILGEVS